MSDSDAEGSTGRTDRGGRREVVVPLRLYKTVIVFSTTIAAIGIVGGFFFLDAATLQVSFFRSTLEVLVSAIGVPIGADLLTGVLALFGLALIVFGTAVFVLGTRFRAEGMGKPQEDSDEDPTNG
ncbi:MAG: DUF7315 family membrane protein [Halobacteriota archaeon]